MNDPIYIDPLINCLVGKAWRWPKSCHMFVGPDTSVEVLHTFAAKIGMRREWFQRSNGGLPHYDLNEKRRFVAVRAGAIELDRRAAVEIIRAYRGMLAAAEGGKQ